MNLDSPKVQGHLSAWLISTSALLGFFSAYVSVALVYLHFFNLRFATMFCAALLLVALFSAFFLRAPFTLKLRFAVQAFLLAYTFMIALIFGFAVFKSLFSDRSFQVFEILIFAISAPIAAFLFYTSLRKQP